MSVVNVKVKHIRPKYQNLKDWMNDPNNVYIGRNHIVFINGKRFPQKTSIFANPFKINRDGSRDVVIKKYEIYMRKRIQQHPETLVALLKLKGKNLGCWCFPEPCHGDVLLQLIEENIS